jgi:hypothetical protein
MKIWQSRQVLKKTKRIPSKNHHRETGAPPPRPPKYNNSKKKKKHKQDIVKKKNRSPLGSLSMLSASPEDI